MDSDAVKPMRLESSYWVVIECVEWTDEMTKETHVLYCILKVGSLIKICFNWVKHNENHKLPW